MHGLQTPAGVDEALGEPIEQFRVRGQAALFAEVTRCADESASEVVLPEAIHHDAGGEGIAWVGDGLGEFESATALGEGGLFAKGAQKLPGDFVSAVEGITPEKNAWCAGQGTIKQDGRVCGCGGAFEEVAIQFRLGFP